MPGSCSRGSSFAGEARGGDAVGLEETLHRMGAEMGQQQLNPLLLQLGPQRAKGLGCRRIQAVHVPAHGQHVTDRPCLIPMALLEAIWE